MEIKNALLKQAADAIQAKVPPELVPTFKRIVLAGEKVMYSPQTHDMMIQQMKSNPDPAEAAGEGIAKLFGILFKESKGTLNMKAAIPAMTVLLCDALDFMEEAGKVKVDNTLLAAATKEMGSSLMQIMGVTPEKLQTMLSKQGGTPQPAGIVAGAQGA